MDQGLSEEVTKLKEELVAIITEHLQNNRIDSQKAQKLANDFLALLPIKNWGDLLAKLKQLSSVHEEAKELYVEELGKAEHRESEQKLNAMRDHIKTGDIEGAISVAKAMPQTTQAQAQPVLSGQAVK